MTKRQLKLLRNKLGLSQAQLAELLGVTQSAVTRWETGDRKISGPAQLLLAQMARAA